MARHRSLLIAALALSVALALPLHARAALGGGLAGDECYEDSECMSRVCEGDGKCAATTCGLTTDKGGVGPSMPAGYCSDAQVYNPSRVCTFGYGMCAKAECCDTLPCGVGVDQIAQSTYCPPSQSFAPTRLCPNGVCTADACCVQTRCDSAGGVAVDLRRTFCASGTMFNNAGICPAGEGNCTADDCCVAETRTCEVAFADSDMVRTYGLTCASPSVLVPTRLFDGASAAPAGGCCETRTCGTTVFSGSSGIFCASTPRPTVFNPVAVCASGTCTTSDCCLQPKGYCDGDATKQPDGTCTCGPGKSYLIGTGCVCSPGTQLVSGACSPCPYGTYSALPTAAQTCASCPANQPYTSSTGADSADRCINYCDQALLSGSGACSNGGVCATLSGDPGAGGSFTCTCPAGWMGYGATVTDNCNAPSTLLRLRVLAASGVTLPADFALSVADAPAAAGDPSYALIASPAGSLACSVTGNPSTPTVPTCSAGGAGALSAALGSAADTRKFVQTKVKLSTNYGNDASYAIAWACSDGTQSTTAALDIVLPGPANTKGAMALVCTAVVGRPLLPAPIKLQLAAGSVVPVPADASTGPAQLTFVQGARPVCTLSVPASSSAPATEPQCAFNDQPFEGGKPGALGVANVDTERYTVLWSCAGAALTTSASGGASTPNLPSPGQPVLVCAVRFAPKTTQLQLIVTSTSASNVKITVTQAGMNDACVATIPAGANNAPATLACPSTSLASGVTTAIKTDADQTKVLVSWVCTTYVPTYSTTYSKGLSTSTNTTRSGDSTPATCAVTVAPLPPLLKLRVFNTANAPAFEAFASQDSSNTCVVSSGGPEVDCFLGDGMSPAVRTTLAPRALDADKYQLKWACASAWAGFWQADFANSATVVLNNNPNDYGATIMCTGTVSLRATPVFVRFDGPLGTQDLLPQGAELRVRQPRQSKACAAVRPLAFVPATCDSEGLSFAAGTRTTLSTSGIALTTTKVTWSCATATSPSNAVPVTLVSAGVATLSMGGTGTSTINCAATLATKPPVLTLEMAVPAGAPPSTAWALSARQSTQGRGCTVPVAASSASTPATAPACEIDTQPLMPARATSLTVPGLDSSRWAVDWSCTYADGPSLAQPLVLVDTAASSSSGLRNSKTVTLDKDANAGGWAVACKATVKARDEVLLLKASGNLPASGWTLTAKQPAQTAACSVPSGAASLAAAAGPTCDAGVVALAADAPVTLGTTGLPESSRVSWACSTLSAPSIKVDQPTTAAATVTPPAGTVTTCTATVTARDATAYFQLVGGSQGISALSATQGPAVPNVLPTCRVTTPGQTLACADLAPGTTTTLTAQLPTATVPAGASVRFSCTLGVSGAAVAVAKKGPLAAVFTSPPAQENVVCTAAFVSKAPILTINSNVPVVLRAETPGGAVCKASGPGTKLECDSGSGAGQLPAGSTVVISQTGQSAEGFYRWGCTSTEAKLSRNGVLTSPAASGTIVLPAASGRPITCWLLYTKGKPSFVRRLMRLR